MDSEILKILNENLTPEQQTEMLQFLYEQITALQDDISFLRIVLIVMVVACVILFSVLSVFIDFCADKDDFKSLSIRVKQLEDDKPKRVYIKK